MAEVNNPEQVPPSVLTVEYLKTVIRQTLPDYADSERKGSRPNQPSSSGVKNPVYIFCNRSLSPMLPINNYDEVYPGIYIGDAEFAMNKKVLRDLGITHILNSAQGTQFARIDTTGAYYADIGLKFMGINAQDIAGFKMAPHFEAAAKFIHEAKSSNGRVAVHCHMGMSRSASLVLAYLLIYEQCPLVEAIKTIRKKRPVFPNDGFLAQLIKLEEGLAQGRETTTDNLNTEPEMQ